MNEKTRILTVDDSASMRALLSHALTGSGYEVEQASDGLEALEWLAHNDVDLVITDINMPRLDGFGLIEQIRAGRRHQDTPILVLSTENAGEKLARARVIGATGWIVKPFDTETLTSTIRRVLY